MTIPLTPGLCLPSPPCPQGPGCHTGMSADVTEETRKRESPGPLGVSLHEDTGFTHFCPCGWICGADRRLAEHSAIPAESISRDGNFDPLMEILQGCFEQKDNNQHSIRLHVTAFLMWQLG